MPVPAPSVVAIIPARGGSKGVHRKNLRLVGGVSLVVRAVRSAQAAGAIDLVAVSTDDEEIAAAAAAAGARVVRRPVAIAGDTASSESALLHALDTLAADGLEPAVVVFLQCTSPFIGPADLDAGVELVADGRGDCAFAALETYEFLWRATTPGLVTGQNHDASRRPRRQDREPDYRETGAFYVMDVAGFRAAGHRFFGRTAVVPVSEQSAIEIDTEAELRLADALAGLLDPPGHAEVSPTGTGLGPDLAGLDVDALVTDFDGVHTPDTCYLDEHGTESVRVSRRDGMGMARLRRAGIPLLILSTEQNPVVARRAAKLQVEVAQGVQDKAAVLTRWCERHELDPARVAFVGNDVNDLAAMAVVGWPIAVADADPAVRGAARLALTRRGGDGAVREVCELVLAAKHRLDAETADR